MSNDTCPVTFQTPEGDYDHSCGRPVLGGGYCVDHQNWRMDLGMSPKQQVPLGIVPNWRWRELRVLALLGAAERFVGYDHDRVRQFLAEAIEVLPQKAVGSDNRVDNKTRRTGT